MSKNNISLWFNHWILFSFVCRFYRKEVENALLWENEVADATAIIKARRQLIFPLAENLIAMEKSGEFHVPLEALMTSMIHMTMNQWFRKKNWLHELVLYEFLYFLFGNSKSFPNFVIAIK